LIDLLKVLMHEVMKKNREKTEGWKLDKGGVKKKKTPAKRQKTTA